MSTSTTRPASRTGQRFPLRKVGSEATKPKPSPAKKVVTPAPPPTYLDQNDQEGVQDEVVDPTLNAIDEAEAEDEAPVHVPAPRITSKKNARPKASRFPAPKKEEDTFESVPSLAILDLVADYKPTPPRPASFTEVHIDFRRMYHMHGAMSGLLTHSKALHKAIPTYNSVFSRLALSLTCLYKTLAARELAHVITYDEAKVMKKLRLAHDFEAQTIPGPLVSFLSAFGLHIPADKRYESICPRLPFQGCEDALDLSRSYIPGSTTVAAYPYFPGLLKLADLVASGTINNTVRNDADDADIALHHQDGRLVLLSLGEDFKDNYRIGNVNLKTAATRKTALRYLYQNSALNVPFPDRLDYLQDVHNSLSIRKVPHFAATDAAAPDLLAYFGLKTDTRWISQVMTALDDEARFFTGNATLGAIGFETGMNSLCIMELSLPTTALEDEWFTDLNIFSHDHTHTVVTTMEDVSDGMMAIATASATLTKYSAGDANSYITNFASYEVPALKREELNPFNGHVQRIIRGVHSIEHRFVNHVKTHHLIDVAKVIGNL